MSGPQASYEEAVALQQAGKLAEARRLYAEVLRLDPAHAKAHNNLGTLLHREGDLDGAIAHYEKALASEELFDAARNLGIAWYERGDLRQAERFSRRALALEPGSAQLKRQLADILYGGALELEKADRVDRALAAYGEALALNPAYAAAALNCGAMHSFQGNSGTAIEHYERALALEPDMALAHFDLGLERLLVGDYEKAWPEYEWRWKLPEFAAQRLRCAQPHWDGEPLDGRTILLYAEQGFGDAIQFVRYAGLVAARGGRVIVRCPPQLTALFRDAESVAGTVSDEQHDLPEFDVCFPLLGLPRLFHTTRQSIAPTMPYVRAAPDKALAWRRRLEAQGKAPRIGLVWGSYSGNERLARRKSIALLQFAPLAAERRDLSFFSLQKGPHREEAERPPAGLALVDLGPELNDFSDTAAVIANLDLVITVDSAVAHLAGAMAKPVWTLVALPLDWRWAGDGRCAWYPTMRVFRQARHGDWDGVLREAAAALARLELKAG